MALSSQPYRQLFYLANDPQEKNDLAVLPEHADRVKQLRQRLDAWWNPNGESSD